MNDDTLAASHDVITGTQGSAAALPPLRTDFARRRGLVRPPRAALDVSVPPPPSAHASRGRGTDGRVTSRSSR
jgi:hypothetical protein